MAQNHYLRSCATFVRKFSATFHMRWSFGWGNHLFDISWTTCQWNFENLSVGLLGNVATKTPRCGSLSHGART